MNIRVSTVLECLIQNLPPAPQPECFCALRKIIAAIVFQILLCIQSLWFAMMRSRNGCDIGRTAKFQQYRFTCHCMTRTFSVCRPICEGCISLKPCPCFRQSGCNVRLEKYRCLPDVMNVPEEICQFANLFLRHTEKFFGAVRKPFSNQQSHNPCRVLHVHPKRKP